MPKRTKKAKTATPRRAGRREGGTVITTPLGTTAFRAGSPGTVNPAPQPRTGLTGGPSNLPTAGGAVTFGGAARPAPRAPGGLTPRRGGAGGAGGGITFPGGFPS